LRKLLAALSLACLLAVPAIATDWDAGLDDLARRWDRPDGPQSEWLDVPDAVYPEGRLNEPIAPFGYAGDGWATLDGWMRRDPLLRQWVLHRFDLNGDTWLSVPEATMARRAFYALADANRSGIITSEEFVYGWSTVRGAVLGGYGYALAG
jgi:hypothetical protein